MIFNRENWKQIPFTKKEKIHTEIFESSEKAEYH